MAAKRKTTPAPAPAAPPPGPQLEMGHWPIKVAAIGSSDATNMACMVAHRNCYGAKCLGWVTLMQTDGNGTAGTCVHLLRAGKGIAE